MIEDIIKSFLTLLVIMNPIGNLPIFISLTKGTSARNMKRNANKAILVASILLFVFLFLGKSIFNFFNISLSSFEIAGGIVLVILGVQYVLGIKFKKEDVKGDDVAYVPIGTPLLTGPGVITIVIVLVSQYGLFITYIAAFMTLFSTWVILYFADVIYKVLGEHWSQAITRIVGLILVAIAVQFIITGVYGVI